MVPEHPATRSLTRHVRDDHTRRPLSRDTGYLATFKRVRHSQQPRPVAAQTRTFAAWLTVGKVVAWVSLVILIDVAIGRGRQLAAESISSGADASDQAHPVEIEIVYARGACPALDKYVDHTMTIDELHDLQDRLCPTLSDPQRSGY
jgi:hypothetical protein